MTHFLSLARPAAPGGARRRRASVLAAGVGMALLVAGCAAPVEQGAPAETEPQRGGTLTVALSSVPPTIDPYATSLQAAWTTARNVCEPLFDTTTTYEVKPVLVDSFDYDGSLSYVFTLRDGVSFQNGEPFTAKDVVASLKRYYETPGNGSILKANTAGLEATGEHEVTLTLKQPSAVVPTLLTTAYMMPASVVEGRPPTDPANDLVCTGPYKLTSYTADQDIVIERWDGYVPGEGEADGGTGEKHAYADKIVFTPLPEASTRRQAVETGQVDIGGALPLDEYESIASSGSAQPLLTPAISGSTVVFNKISGVMSDVRMRQAFLAALDMTEIMTAGFGNPEFFTVDGSIIPETNEVWASDAGTDRYNARDLDQVKTLLAEAGYNGEPIVWLTTKDDTTWYAPSLPAQQQLKEAGINIDLQVVDQATIIQRRNDPTKYDLFSSGIPTYADPVLLPYLQDTFPGGWKDAKKNELLGKLATEPDQARRKAVWDELQTEIWTQVPFLKFGTTKALIVAGKDVHVDKVLELTGYYYNVWLSK